MMMPMHKVEAVMMNADEIKRCCERAAQDGFGSLQTERGHLPLKALSVDATINGLVGRVRVTQRFVNTHDQPLEATYIFPLPDRAAVRHFTLRVAGRTIAGELKERGAARREYAQAISQGHRAAIAEEDRPDVFNLRVGNIAPGEEAEVELVLVGPLDWADGEATWRFPLVVAPRYIPGTPLDHRQVGAGVAQDTDATPDASRISPPVLLAGYPNPVQLAIRVHVDAGALQLGTLRSSLHEIQIERGERVAEIVLHPGERLDRDFILRFGLEADKLGATCIAALDDPQAAEGTFQLLMVAPQATRQATIARDVVFVLDRSGSMDGWKMVAARRAIGRMVDTLGAQDRFNVYAFDDRIETMPGTTSQQLIEATNRNRWKAVEYLGSVEARGGTELAQPLNEGASLLGEGYQDRARMLVLVTDGQVGNEDQILRSLQPRLGKMRVFTVGIDEAVNAGFLRRLAEVSGGACELIEGEDRLDAAMDRLHRMIDTPVLMEVQIDVSGEASLEAGSVVPARLPGLFAGQPLIVSGRFRGRPQGSVRVRAAHPDGQPFVLEVPMSGGDAEALGAVWARGQIRSLEDRYALRAENLQALEQKILHTSLKFGVLSRFTAYVAVDRAAKITQDAPLHKVTQAVEQPHGWQGSAHNMPAPAPMMSPSPAAPMAMSPGAPPPPSPMPGVPMPGAPMPASPVMQAPQEAFARSRRANTSPAPQAPMGYASSSMDRMESEGAADYGMSFEDEEVDEEPMMLKEEAVQSSPEPAPVEEREERSTVSGGLGQSIGSLFEKAKKMLAPPPAKPTPPKPALSPALRALIQAFYLALTGRALDSNSPDPVLHASDGVKNAASVTATLHKALGAGFASPDALLGALWALAGEQAAAHAHRSHEEQVRAIAALLKEEAKPAGEDEGGFWR
jgi:Ca-activated chloride channel homolog